MKIIIEIKVSTSSEKDKKEILKLGDSIKSGQLQRDLCSSLCDCATVEAVFKEVV